MHMAAADHRAGGGACAERPLFSREWQQPLALAHDARRETRLQPCPLGRSLSLKPHVVMEPDSASAGASALASANVNASVASAASPAAACSAPVRPALNDRPTPPLPAGTATTQTAAAAPWTRAVEDKLDAFGSRLQCHWISLRGLLACAVARLEKELCTGISELGHGSHNSLYRLVFADGSTCAASIANAPPLFFSVDAKRSEIATMQYLHASPLYNIPVPRVFAWDLTYDNPVGAPYVLREVVTGMNMSEDGRFYQLNSEDKIKVIRELALVQAELSKPSEFDRIGCLYRRDVCAPGESEFYVGKLSMPRATDDDDDLRGPYASLPELWQARIEHETLAAIHSITADPPSPQQPPSPPSASPPPPPNPQEFGELLQLLSGMTSLFTPPKELSRLCVHHSDLALRNVLFDDKTLKITGVIDWEFASIQPLVVSGRFPNDLGWEGNEFARSLGKLGTTAPLVWNHHYFDWTSLAGVVPPRPAPGHDPCLPSSPPHTPASSISGGDYLSTPVQQRTPSHDTTPPTTASSTNSSCSTIDMIPPPPSPPLPPPPTSETSQQDLNTRASNLIKLFYLRKYYAGRVASADFTLTRMFIDSVAYVKFNEVVLGGAAKWLEARDWIREVYWRLCEESPEKRAALIRGEQVVRMPEVFDVEADRGVVDLGRWEERLRAGRGRCPMAVPITLRQ